MTEPFQFTLLFRLPVHTPEAESHLDALYEAGCDDAVVGTGRAGYVALDFNREGDDADSAINSAIGDVARAIPGAELMTA